MLFKVINISEASSGRPRRRQRRVGIEPRRVRRRRAPVAGLDASREEHAVAAVFAGPPQLKSGRGRRVCSAQVPNGYSDFGLRGRGRQIGLASREQTCRRARRACATACEAPLTYVRQRAPSATWTAFLSSFRFQVKRPEHAPLLRERTRKTPQRTQQPAQPASVGGGRARRSSNSSFRRNRPDHPSREASGTPQPKNYRRRNPGPSGGFTKYIPTSARPPPLSNFPTARPPRPFF